MTHDTLPISNMVAPQLPSLIEGKLLGEPAPGLTLRVSAHYRATLRFATSEALIASENRFYAAIEGMRTDFRAMTDQVSKLVLELIRRGNDADRS